MKLSTKCRYGIHAMFDLAQNVGQGPQTLRQISERQMISEQYLEQIVGTLRREGMVTSVRGAQGGYMLARPAEEITVGQMIRVLEGPLFFTDCLVDKEACVRSGQCPSRLVWERLNDCINGVIDSITLKDMLDNPSQIIRGETQE